MTKAQRRQAKEENVLGQLGRVARDNSGDDPVLAEVLSRHLRYNWGKGRNSRIPRIDEPHVVNGVKFWRVGHNASYEFYIGTDGSGKRFSYSIGESCTVDIEGNPLVFDDEGFPVVPLGVDSHFREVIDFHGYYGHF